MSPCIVHSLYETHSGNVSSCVECCVVVEPKKCKGTAPTGSAGVRGTARCSLQCAFFPLVLLAVPRLADLRSHRKSKRAVPRPRRPAPRVSSDGTGAWSARGSEVWGEFRGLDMHAVRSLPWMDERTYCVRSSQSICCLYCVYLGLGYNRFMCTRCIWRFSYVEVPVCQKG